MSTYVNICPTYHLENMLILFQRRKKDKLRIVIILIGSFRVKRKRDVKFLNAIFNTLKRLLIKKILSGKDNVDGKLLRNTS